jgi:hypothetical protein
MREPIHTFVFVLAIVLFFLAAVPWTPPLEPWRLRLISAGLFCWALSSIITI